MINSVSGLNFKGSEAQTLFESPGKFAQQPSPKVEEKADEFVKPKKNNHVLLKTIGTIVGVAALVFGGSWGLSKFVKVNPEATNFLRKGLNKVVEFGEGVGNTVAGWFGRGKAAVDDVEEIIEEVAEATV